MVCNFQGCMVWAELQIHGLFFVLLKWPLKHKNLPTVQYQVYNILSYHVLML